MTLANGTTLIAGGQLPDGTLTDDISIYDAKTGAASSVGHLSAGRVHASAALLSDGRVVISGGESAGIISADLEIYDPASGATAPMALMSKPRTRHASARLADGRVLIAGGASGDTPAVADAEIYDPATNTAIAAESPMAAPRAGATATTLIDGRVLVVGGTNGAQDLASAELYYGGAGFFATDTSLSVARSGHTAVLLPDNATVLVAGGTAAGTPVATTDAFLPALFPDPYTWSMGTFAAANPLGAARTGAASGPTGNEGFAFVAGGGVAEGEQYRFPTIKTDKDDYPPGQLALITGTGWQPGESVRLTFQEDPAVHDDYIRTVVADADGRISLTDWAPDAHDANVRFYLMAMGQQSARRAQMTFTDSVSSVTITAPTAASPVTVAQGDSFTVSFTYTTSVTGTTTATAYLCAAPANACNTNNQITSASKTVTSGTAQSNSITLTVPAGATVASTYRVQVDVENNSGGGSNSKSDGQNDAVNVVLAKLTPTISTDIHNTGHTVVTAVDLGATVHDSVSVTGTGATPTGTVTLSFFADSACTDPATATSSALTLSGGSVDGTAFPRGPLAAGSYSFRASYSGDTAYKSGVGACEPLTVNKSQLAVTSAVHDANHANKTGGSVDLGSVMHDTASLSGTVSGFTAPSIAFTFYSNNTCSAATSVATSGTEGGSTTSADSAALAAGQYSYKASVAGNANYLGDDSDCETFTVNKKQLAISTQIHDKNHNNVGDATHVPLGSVVHDTATVTGAVSGFAVPAVTFTFGGSPIGTAASAEIGFTASSAVTSALAAGSYVFNASVGSDDNYLGATSLDEPLTVDKAQLTITTTLHNAAHGVVGGAVHVPLGSVVHDNATVGGGVSGFAIPAVAFSLDSNALGSAASAESSFTASSVGTSNLAAGDYVFKASVAGDTNYLGATSADEPLTVDKAQLTISSQIHNAAHGDVGDATHVALGSVVHDTAKVSGAVSGFAVPAVTFTFDGVAIANGSPTETGFDASTVATSALSAGSHTFVATIAGNANYLGGNSGDEKLTVDAAATTVVASVPTVTPQYSDQAKLRAVVTPYEVGPFQLTGTVYFYVGSAAANCSTVNTSTAVGNDPILDADNGVAEILYTVPGPAQAAKVTACFVSNTGNFLSSGDDESFTVAKEDATFTNVVFPTSMQVSQTSFTLTADVQELRTGGVEPDPNDGALPGDISKVTSISARIVGISTGTQYTGACDTGSGGSANYTSARSFVCFFGGGPFVVDAYTLTLDIPTANTYWVAATYEDALSVWDPAAGFATGGGTFNLGGDRVSFGFSYTLQKGKTVPRSGFVVVRHMVDGGVCRVKSNNQMNAPAVNGTTVTLSGKGNYTCSDRNGNTTASQGNINIAAYAEDISTSGIGADRFWVSNGAAVAPNYLVMPTPASTTALVLTGGNVQVPQPSKK